MTVQRRRLIELRDILAIELRCRDCGTTLGMPPGKVPSVDRMAQCPNCREDWLDKQLAEKFAAALEALAALRRDLEARKEAPHGVDLHLEVSDDPIPPQ